MSSYRDRFLTPPVARAITSPSAILVTAAGASVGILLGLSPIGIVVLGAAALSARVLSAVPRKQSGPKISPGTLGEPWRSLMTGILDAKKRFSYATKGMKSGPLNNRLSELGDHLQAGVDEAWRIAQAGNQLSLARGQIRTDTIAAELQLAQAAGRTERSDQTIQALQAQLAAAQRLDGSIHDTYDRLRLLDARIDEMVTRTVELSVSQVSPDDLGGLNTEVDSIVEDMEALRQAVEEASGIKSGGEQPDQTDQTDQPEEPEEPEEPQLGTSTGSV